MSLSIRGVEMHYYDVCHRKLWLFNKGIGFEETHDRVMEGKVLHERAYPRAERDVEPDEYVQIDREDGEYLREIKLTSRMINADRLQMLYYLYVIKQKGIKKKGLLSYTKEKKTEEVELDELGERRVKEALQRVPQILADPLPSFKRLPYCSKCAYYDFCMAGEAENDGT